MERVSIQNIVVRFFSDRAEAADQAGIMNMKVYQHDNINQFVVCSDIQVGFPEIFDTTGVIFSEKTQKRNIESRLWVAEFIKDLKEA